VRGDQLNLEPMTMTKTALPLVITAGVRAPRDDRRDADCFARLVRGDRSALGDLYDMHAASLFRHGLALTRRPGEAEDLVQAVFLKLAATGAPLLAVRRPANYLHRILHAAWIDSQRRPAATNETAIGANEEFMTGEPPSPVESTIDVTRALAALPAAQREAVQLHLIEGFSFREVGRIVGVSMFTAASRYRAALQRLRELLGKR
jgi:RNA polymerase sigma-70 factor (ECF subfamily)